MHMDQPLASMTGAQKADASIYSRAMPFLASVSSVEAETAVAAIIHDAILPNRPDGKQARPSMLPKYRAALGAFLPDLLGAFSAQRWGRCATSTQVIHAHPGGAVAFREMRNGMRAAGLIDDLPGLRRSVFDGDATVWKYRQTCFRPTRALLELLHSQGIDPSRYREHFKEPEASMPIPAALVELRGRKPGKGKNGARIPLDLSAPVAAEHVARVVRFNEFLSTKGRVSGFRFGGLRRLFHNADQPGFEWQWGGRFYSPQRWEAYESFPSGKNPDARPVPLGETRSERIRLDGQRVAEVDLSAAHLTILYGLCGVPFDPNTDPYAIDGFPREQVKVWVRSAMGAGDTTKGGNRRSKVRKAVMAKHLVLERIGGPGRTTLDLQYHESE